MNTVVWVLILGLAGLALLGTIARGQWHRYQDKRIRAWRRQQNWRDYRASRRQR